MKKMLLAMAICGVTLLTSCEMEQHHKKKEAEKKEMEKNAESDSEAMKKEQANEAQNKGD